MVLLTPEEWHESRHAGRRDSKPFEQCWYCGRARARCRRKIRFATREEADEWVAERNKNSGFRDPAKRYRCRWCLGYHMARPKRPHELKRIEKHRRKWLRAIGGVGVG